MLKACNYAECMNDYNKYRELNLLVRLAPTLLGEKPLHIFCFNEKFPFLQKVLNDLMQLFDAHPKINLRIVLSENRSIKAIIYHVPAAEHVLADHRNRNFLTSRGFAFDLDTEGFMDYLEKNLKQNRIPNEYGLFFGYPLKDVMGFIGHPSLKHVKTLSWKVYGNPKASEEIFKRYQQAEKRILAFIQERTSEEINLDVFQQISA